MFILLNFKYQIHDILDTKFFMYFLCNRFQWFRRPSWKIEANDVKLTSLNLTYKKKLLKAEILFEKEGVMLKRNE